MADAKTWVDLIPKYDTAGTLQTAVRFSKRTVVGPASYAADGIPVDLSATFSTLHAVRILRAYVTSSGAPDSREYEVNEISTDTLANRKFRVKVFRIPTISGTQDADVIKATGTVTNGGSGASGVWAGTQSGGNACIVGCDNTDHPGTTPTNVVSNVIAGSGASKVSAFTALTTPTVAKTEIDAATNLSTVTVEFEAVGVPA